MTFPKRPKSHVTGDRAVQLFKAACEPSWVLSNVSPDYGLDLRIELTDADQVIGHEILVQIKGSSRLVEAAPTIDIRQRTINYWLAKLAPVLISLVDITSGVIWYEWLENSYRAYPKQRGDEGVVPLTLSRSVADTPLSEEIPRYASRYYGQLGASMTNLVLRARLLEMLFHVVTLTHLFYDIWFYVEGMPRKKETMPEVLEKLRSFLQEFGTHDAYLQIPWRQFSAACASSAVRDAFESCVAVYNKLKATFFSPGSAGEQYPSIPIVGGHREPPGTLVFLPLRFKELVAAIGPAIRVLRDIEGLIFRILMLGRLRFADA